MGVVIELRDVRKSYVPGIAVLQGVDLDVRAGEVTALVGANGSGKSTLVKILSGYHEPDRGSRVRFGDQIMEGHIHPAQARAAGVRFVHQDSRMVTGVSVLENLLVDRLGTASLDRLDWPAERRRAQAFLDEHRITVDVREDAGSVSLADAAKIAIARAAGPESDTGLRALILDEPTAALGRDDAAEMLDWARALARGRGVGVLLIGHRLEEILATADRVAVLRNGRIVADTLVAELDHDRLVEQIVGHAIDAYYPEREGATGAPVLEVGDLRGGEVRGISFTVAAGEVLGVTGLPGSGFEDLPYLLMDPRAGARGALTVAGREIQVARTPVRTRVQAGLALVPADRKRRALATSVSVTGNVGLPHLRRFRTWSGLSARAEHHLADGVVRDYAVSPADARVITGNLSGGNQQKVVIGKWMSTRPRVLVVHEPTQAVDVGAKAEIFKLLADAAAEGMAAVIVSVEYDDLAHLCDRVLVVGAGRVVAELSGDALSPESLATAAYRSGVEGLPEPASMR
ncbi:sugar ABC transporter ATP-binding protein [Nocardioides sp. SLBN-35]|uniref:sugar ABC transporter ATP-binding protein n=1 Tax=Nocardioides sp. SLBN-35 TaxID=2768445 RepID=UPI001153AA23|nr:sugar ABC transporter ATP-binding protein [Nocardioides sp. SLBN-35]TQK69061.1 monosaccharide ABC transporter ATP-binding protein (CUT2 family) [Nocardioides sp. SLBN-35]